MSKIILNVKLERHAKCNAFGIPGFASTLCGDGFLKLVPNANTAKVISVSIGRHPFLGAFNCTITGCRPGAQITFMKKSLKNGELSSKRTEYIWSDHKEELERLLGIKFVFPKEERFYIKFEVVERI